MALFKKTEKTEEEIKKAEQRKIFWKGVGLGVCKVVGGVIVFTTGALLVTAALGLSVDSSEDSTDGDDDTLTDSDVTFVDHEESENPAVEEAV